MKLNIVYFTLLFIANINANTIKILATTSILADITKNISGEYCSVNALLPIGGDPHTYEAIPSDVQKIKSANIIIKNGMGLEGWLLKLLDNKNAETYIVDASEGINGIESPIHKNAFDPHVWMNPNLVKIQAKNIYEALVQIDNIHSRIYYKNYLNYINKLSEVDTFIKKKIALIPREKRIIITSHDAFSYFGKEYGLIPEGILGISTDADAQTSDIIRIRNLIIKHKIPSIFVESNVNPKLIQQIAGDLQLNIGEKLYADSLGDSVSTANNYINMMRYNAEAIANGLSTSIVTKNIQKNNNYAFYVILIAAMILSFIFVVKNLKTN